MTKRIEDINGWYEIKDNPITKVGVFPYSGAQIDPKGEDPEIDPNRIYQVYRPAEELADEACIESFKLIPITNEHALLGSELEGLLPAEQKGVEGVTGQDVKFRDGYLLANIKIFSESLKYLIQNGKKELSAAYRCVYDKVSGVWEGKKFDFIQRKPRGNHTAVVMQGRSGHDVAVLDKFTFAIDTKEIEKMQYDQEVRDELTLESLNKKIDSVVERLSKIIGAEKAEAEIMQDDSEFKKEEKQAEDNKDIIIDETESDEKKEKEIMSKERKEEKYAAMDSALKNMQKEIIQLKQNGMKSFLKEMTKRDELAKNLSNVVGVFDSSEMSVDEVAAYGVKKLGLTCQKGQESAALDGYFCGLRNSYKPTSSALDKVEVSESFQAYLNDISD